MIYDTFDQLQEGPYARGTGESEQAYMERILRRVCIQALDHSLQRINDMLCAAYCKCDASERSLTLEFAVFDWMCNPAGTLHGGVLTTAMDMTLGLLARYYKKSWKVVTVQLSVSFLRTVRCGEKFQIHATLEKIGSRAIFLHGKATSSANGESVADATAVFM